MRRIILLLFILIALFLFWFFWNSGTEAQVSQPPMVQLGVPGDEGAFARAMETRSFSFPSDHGPHFDYQTEWWYFTGNLENSEGRHFGYQLTFFRRGLSPGNESRPSSFATNQVYFAHFAITDVASGSHQETERFSRGVPGLAGASGDPFRVWLENWSLQALNEDGSHVQLSAKDVDLSLELELRSTKPIVLHGDGGLSPKSIEPGNASYYLSYTRMETSGKIQMNGDLFRVQGQSWFDHEWSTTVLGENAVGWDWFGIQLSDGREIMFFLVRNRDGSFDSVSSGTLVEPDGKITTFDLADLEIQTLERWQSPETGADYPVSWKLRIPLLEVDLDIEPWLSDQEMRTSLVYWEGAVKASGTSKGLPITGNGYVELTGYAYSFQGLF